MMRIYQVGELPEDQKPVRCRRSDDRLFALIDSTTHPFICINFWPQGDDGFTVEEGSSDDDNDDDDDLSAGAIAGIAIGGGVAFLMAVVTLVLVHSRSKPTPHPKTAMLEGPALTQKGDIHSQNISHGQDYHDEVMTEEAVVSA
jgi:hypothetical protein